jgi:putative flippase GtrA
MPKQQLRKVRDLILRIADFFYPPFKRFMPKHTFRYLACGSTNTLLDIVLYYCAYHYLLKGQEVSLGFVNISPHIMAFICGFCITFPISFILSKYIVFPESELRGRVQFFRYAALVVVMISMNYLFLKLFVEVLNFYPTVAKIITTVIVAVFSYISQKNFSFKMEKPTEEKTD